MSREQEQHVDAVLFENAAVDARVAGLALGEVRMQELTISRFAGQWQPTNAVGGSRAFRQQQQRLSVPSVPLVQLSRTEVHLTDQRAERFDKPETGICRWCPEQPKVDIMLKPQHQHRLEKTMRGWQKQGALPNTECEPSKESYLSVRISAFAKV